MAGTLILNANSLVNSGRGGWDSVGTSNVVTAVSDNSDLTYIKMYSPESGYNGAYGMSIKYRVEAKQLPGGAKTRYMRAVCRARTSNASAEQYFRLLIQNYSAGNINGNNWTSNGPQLFASTAWKEVANTADSFTRSNGVLTNGGVIDQNAINNLAIEVYNVEGTNILQFSKLWIEVYYDEKPTITLTPLNTVINTTSPVLTWLFTDDLETQAAVDVQILNNSGTVIHEVTKFPTTASSYGIPISLANGTYTARVRAHQAWKWTGDAPVSDWKEISFTIAVSVPAVPTFTAYEEPDQARVRLVAEHNLNLMSESAAEAEVSAWDATTNGNLYAGDVFLTGDRSLLVEAVSNGNSFIRSVPAIPVTAGKAYGFSVKSRPHTGDPAITFQACIRWLNAAGSTISDGGGSTVSEIASQWVDSSIKATAPVGAVYAKPFVIYISNVANSWRYLDSPIFAALPSTGSTIPAWSRGGFASPTINMLGFVDSTMEGASHWSPVDGTTAVSTVNVITETGDPYFQFQGNNALKVQTTGILARRDNETAVVASGTSITINRGDVVEGDFLLAFITINSSSTTITTPAGWTLVDFSNVSTTVKSAVYSRVAGASEPSTYSWTFSGTVKAGGHITSYTGVQGIYAYAKGTNTSAATVHSMPASTTLHNGYVVESVSGVRAASASATTWTTNMSGANYDAQVSTTANTANEIALGTYSSRYATELVTAQAVSGNTLTSSASLTASATWTIVLQAKTSTTRASLASYETYPIDTTKNYVATFACIGADWGSVNSANRNVAVLVELLDNAKNPIASYYVAQGAAVVGAWKKFSAIINIPDTPTAVFASVRVEIDSMTDGEAYLFDAISLYQSDANLGFMEGYKITEGPFMELQYSENGGDDWKSGEVLEITDPTSSQVTFLDYEIGSGVDRLYRFINYRVEDSNLLQSGFSATADAGITLYRIWMHLITDPAGTIYQFPYEEGRSDDFGKKPTILQFAGREYGQAHFGENSERSIDGNAQLLSGAAVVAMKKLNDTKALVIFRDGRGRRVKGLLDVKFTDVNYGNTATFKVTVLGDQPW